MTPSCGSRQLASRSPSSASPARPGTSTRAANEWKDGDSLFLTCTVWRQAAENVAESLTRGMRVIVTGRLKQRSYETKEGEKRTVYELEVDEVGPSLRNASAKVTKVTRTGAGGQTAGQRQGTRTRGPATAGGLLGRASVLADPAQAPVRTSPPGGRLACTGGRRSRSRIHYITFISLPHRLA